MKMFDPSDQWSPHFFPVTHTLSNSERISNFKGKCAILELISETMAWSGSLLKRLESELQTEPPLLRVAELEIEPFEETLKEARIGCGALKSNHVNQAIELVRFVCFNGASFGLNLLPHDRNLQNLMIPDGSQPTSM